MSGVKVGGTWLTPGSAYVKVAGVWRNVATVSVKAGGAWRVSTMGSPPAAPVMTYVSHGTFAVSNPIVGAIYTATRVSGTGSAIWDAATSRFNLSDANARFSVTAGWASNAPQSAAHYIERHQYDYTPDTRTWGTCGGNYTGGECLSFHPVPPPCGAGSGCGANCDNPSWCCDSHAPSVYHPPYSCVTGGSAPSLVSYASSGYTDSGTEWFKLS